MMRVASVPLGLLLSFARNGLALVCALSVAGCFQTESKAADSCAWVARLPADFVGENGTTTFHVKADGCRLLLSGLDVEHTATYVEKVTFSPAILLLDASKPLSRWTVNGTGQYEAETTFDTNRSGPDVKIMAGYDAKVLASSLGIAGESVHQWAQTARASSGAAKEATGGPNSRTKGNNSTAWMTTPGAAREEWIEISFSKAVIPATMRIWEMDVPGVVTRVEGRTDGGAWTTLWSGKDETYGFPGLFEPTLPEGLAPMRDFRISLSTLPGHPHGIDAVEVVGGAGVTLAFDITWAIKGPNVCDGGACEPGAPLPDRDVRLHIDTATARFLATLPTPTLPSRSTP